MRGDVEMAHGPTKESASAGEWVVTCGCLGLMGLMGLMGLIIVGVPLFVLWQANAILYARTTSDAVFLKRLAEAYANGRTANGLPAPKSRGWRFWVALYVGDGPGTKDGFFPATNADTYIDLREYKLLISTSDPVPDVSALETRLANALGNGGAAVADNTWTSFAGPTAGHLTFANPTEKNRVVGASGTRDGLPFHARGFTVLYANLSAEFIGFDDAAEKWGWPPGTQDFEDANGPLAHVTNIESDTE